jgi:hypothetical protein
MEKSQLWNRVQDEANSPASLLFNDSEFLNLQLNSHSAQFSLVLCYPVNLAAFFLYMKNILPKFYPGNIYTDEIKETY